MPLSVMRPSSAGVCAGGGAPACCAESTSRSADTASLSPVTLPSLVWHARQWRSKVIGWKPTRSGVGSWLAAHVGCALADVVALLAPRLDRRMRRRDRPGRRHTLEADEVRRGHYDRNRRAADRRQAQAPPPTARENVAQRSVRRSGWNIPRHQTVTSRKSQVARESPVTSPYVASGFSRTLRTAAPMPHALRAAPSARPREPRATA